MEWAELQAVWQQYDARMAENTRINREILKRMLRVKPERRISRMKGWAIYGMIVPIPIMCTALVTSTKLRNEWDFYLGLILIVIMLAKVLYQTVQYFLLIRAINFTHCITQTKKQLQHLDKFMLKMSKWGWPMMFIGMAGICLLCQLPVMTKDFTLMTVFIILCAAVSSYIKFKRFREQLNRFNAELDEIENLEKE